MTGKAMKTKKISQVLLLFLNRAIFHKDMKTCQTEKLHIYI